MSTTGHRPESGRLALLCVAEVVHAIIGIDQRAVHDEDVKDISIVAVLDDATMVEYRLRTAVLFHEVEADIIIVPACLRIDLLPDARFDGLLLIRSNQVTEAVLGVREELLEVVAAGEAHELMICEQDLIILRIRSVYQKGPRKMLSYFLQCKAELASMLRLIGALVRSAALFSMQLYGIKRHIGTADQL